MDKKEYEWKKKLIELETESKLKVGEYFRTTEKLKHEWSLERGRIKSAEIRKAQERQRMSR